MAISVTMKHIVPLKNGSLKFQRRMPANIFRATGKRFYEITLRNRDTNTVAFMKEYEFILREWQSLVDTFNASKSAAIKTPQQAYNDALKKRAELLEGVVGLSEEDAVSILLDTDGQKMNTLMRRVMADPEGSKPAFTMIDAKARYVEDKGIASNIKKMQRLDRTFDRLKNAVGDPSKLALVDLKKAHGQAWLDVLKGYRQADGKPYAVDTMKRMTNDLKAIVNHSIAFVDFDQHVTNPFMKLPFPEEAQISVGAIP